MLNEYLNKSNQTILTKGRLKEFLKNNRKKHLSGTSVNMFICQYYISAQVSIKLDLLRESHAEQTSRICFACLDWMEWSRLACLIGLGADQG